MSGILRYAHTLRRLAKSGAMLPRMCSMRVSLALGAATALQLCASARAATSGVPFVAAIHYTYVDQPVARTQDAYSTTLETLSGDQVVSRATFYVPFANPQVQQAVSDAQAILASDGSQSVSGPVLISTFITQSSSLSYETTGHSATATESLGPPVATIGPNTIDVDLNYISALKDFDYSVSPQPVFVPLGEEYFAQPTTFNWTVYRNAVTTQTILVSQTYSLTGAGSDVSMEAPESAALPSAAWSGFVTISCIVLVALVRGKLAVVSVKK
jgi:hypothetical protein